MAPVKKPRRIKLSRAKKPTERKQGLARWLDSRIARLNEKISFSHSAKDKKEMKARIKEMRKELSRLRGAA